MDVNVISAVCGLLPTLVSNAVLSDNINTTVPLLFKSIDFNKIIEDNDWEVRSKVISIIEFNAINYSTGILVFFMFI